MNGVEAGAPFMKLEAISDQAVAASLIFPGSLASLPICSCQRSRYFFANASKSGGAAVSFVTRGFPGLFRREDSVLLCIAI